MRSVVIPLVDQASSASLQLMLAPNHVKRADGEKKMRWTQNDQAVEGIQWSPGHGSFSRE